MEHRFTGRAYTLGIEEELMIVDAETLDLSNSIEAILSALPPVEGEPQVKEELMESVVEIMTTPAGSIDEVGEQLRGLRRTVQARPLDHRARSRAWARGRNRGSAARPVASHRASVEGP